jgi:serine/threonine protein kinase
MSFKDNFLVKEKICETSYSIVYKSVDKVTNRTMVIKMERQTNGTSHQSDNYLRNETKIRKFLEHVNGIPKITDYGVYKSRRYIVYPYLPSTLYNMRLSIPQLFNCGKQLLDIVSNIHKTGIVHCDISPMNVFCNQERNRFYLSDFGQARHFSFALSNNREKMVGCPMFCSLNVHHGHEYSYRDDLISIGYLLYYCHRGRMPWSGMKTCREISESKELFRKKYGSLGIPEELKIYLNYCFHLGINTIPEYEMLQKLFVDNIKQLEIET